MLLPREIPLVLTERAAQQELRFLPPRAAVDRVLGLGPGHWKQGDGASSEGWDGSRTFRSLRWYKKG